MRRKTTRNLTVLGLATAALAACTSTSATEVAVHYAGGPLSSKSPEGCVEKSSRDYSVFDTYRRYPLGQVVYDFTGKDGADAEPIEVVSKDNQTLTIPGQITMFLNTRCDVLQSFDVNVGGPRSAYLVEKDGEYVKSDGWRNVLALYQGRAADATLDRVAKRYTRDELFSDPTIKDVLNKEVNEQIAKLVNQQMGVSAKGPYFVNYSASMGQPDPGQDYRNILTQQQNVIAEGKRAQAEAESKASAAEAAARAQVAQKQAERKVAEEEAKIQRARISAYGNVRNYLENKALDKGLNLHQPSYGTAPTPVVPVDPEDGK